MPEILLHFIWQKGLFRSYPQALTDGTLLQVIAVGTHNTDAGPDFSAARIRLGNPDDGSTPVEQVGNIEIHVRSSDWYRHRHHLDPAYDNIILHVVREADKPVYNSRGELIPQCVLTYPMDEDYLTRLLREARQMDSPLFTHRCAKRLLNEPALLTEGWRRTLLRDRLRCKASSVNRLLAITHGSWEQAFYITLAHCFGFHTNGIPFELLAIQTPLQYLLKHRNSLFQLTAILLGQAGLLAETDPLYKEYVFLQHKFSLQPIDAHLWKNARMRPQNFPETRIRQFAALIHHTEFLFSRLMDATSLDQLEALLMPAVESLPGLVVPPMGRESVRLLLINAVIPYKFAHGEQAQAMTLLEALPAENNNIIRQWRTLGQKAETAADTQALIHLYTVYCQSDKCINCDVAYQIFLH